MQNAEQALFKVKVTSHMTITSIVEKMFLWQQQPSSCQSSRFNVVFPIFQFQEDKSNFQMMSDYKGSCYTASVTTANPDLVNGSGTCNITLCIIVAL